MTKHSQDPTPNAIVRDAHAEESSEVSDDETSKTSVRQLLHWASGDREAEAQALADESPGDVSQKDAEVAVKRAHGDVPSDRPAGASEVATPADAEDVSKERDVGPIEG